MTSIFIVLCLSTFLNSQFHLFNLNQAFSLLIIPEPFQLLIGPLFYFYLLNLNEGKVSRTNYLTHLSLFLLFLIFTLFLLINIKSPIFDRQKLQNVVQFLAFFAYLQIWIYYFLCRNSLEKYRNRLKQSCSTIDKIKQSWMEQSLFALLIGYSAITVVYVLNHSSFKLPINKSLAIITSSLIYFIAYKTLRQPSLFSAPPIERIEKIVVKENPAKYQKSPLKEEDMTNGLAMLEAYMAETSPYRNPELDLKSLALGVGFTPHLLSQIINSGMRSNFYDYINRYRLNEVIKQFQDPVKRGGSILDIAFDAGFNSKATFNRIFKRTFSLTPSKYRQQLESSDKPIKSSKN